MSEVDGGAASGVGEPVVSVMIPAYGDNALVREAVASVLAQDSPRWRLTMFDDGPDDPQLRAWMVGLGDPRVRYERNPQRLGINGNFQRCVDEADGDLVVLLGADDRMLPGYVRIVAAAAVRHPGASWLQPAVRVIDGAGEVTTGLTDRVKTWISPHIEGERELGGEELARSLLRGLWMYFPAVTFRREALAKYGFRPGWDIVLDLDLYLRILLDGGHAVYLDEVAFEYRRHGASLSSTEIGTGIRFAEERSYYAEVRRAARAAGWPRAGRAASVHLTSRLHALTTLPGALRSGNGALIRAVTRHAFGPTEG
jgi:glycosyltransferase involved in cell wall biosynthesis